MKIVRRIYLFVTSGSERVNIMVQFCYNNNPTSALKLLFIIFGCGWLGYVGNGLSGCVKRSQAGRRL